MIFFFRILLVRNLDLNIVVRWLDDIKWITMQNWPVIDWTLPGLDTAATYSVLQVHRDKSYRYPVTGARRLTAYRNGYKWSCPQRVIETNISRLTFHNVE